MLLNFVYGHVVMNEVKVFGEFQKVMKGKMHVYGMKQLSQCIYALSRVKQQGSNRLIHEAICQYEKLLERRESIDPRYDVSYDIVTILWSFANTKQVDRNLFLKLLLIEIDNIPKYNSRRFVQLMNALGTLALPLSMDVTQRLFLNILQFYKKNGK